MAKSAAGRNQMFKTRLISGVILVALALLFIIIGGNLLLVVSAILSVIGLFELYRVFRIEKTPVAICGYLFTIFYYIKLGNNNIPFLLLIMAFLLAILIIFVIRYPRYRSQHIMAAFFGVFYVSIMLSCVYQTRMLPDGGVYLVWLIFLSAWGSDTCAYCAGMLFGKHKMTPKLSPKKTIEGAIGGIVGAAILGLIYGAIFHGPMNIGSREIVILAIVCAVGAVIAMIGDLCASAIKRNYKVKDYGHLIPGHGGIMDRFDSIIFTAPVILYLSIFFL